jgi:replication factor A1
MELTPAAVWMLCNKAHPENYTPLVQILEFSKLKEKNYKFVISDSYFRNQVLGGVELLKKFGSEDDVLLSIVKITHHSLVYNSGKPILCVKDIDFVKKCSEIIGDPKPYKHEEFKEHQVREMIGRPDFSKFVENSLENITTKKIPKPSSPAEIQLSTAERNRSPHHPNSAPQETREPQPARKQPLVRVSTGSVEERKGISPREPLTPNNIPSQGSHLQYSISKNKDLYTPIAHLVPSNNEWIIKSRIFSKSEIRHFNAKTAGKLFKCNLVDSYGSEIEATFFNEGADMFFDKIQEGRVYTLSNGKVKMVNARYNKSENDFQITFDKNAMIVEQCDDGRIPYVSFQFTNFDRIFNFPPNSFVDILAIVTRIDEPVSFRSRNDKDLVKRMLTVVEYNERFMEIVFWGDQANDPIFSNLDTNRDHILAIKNVRVNEFKGQKNFSVDRSSKYFFNPTDIKDADKLLHWWETKKFAIPPQRMSGTSGASLTCIKEINKKWDDVDFDSTEKGSYIVHAFISTIRDDQTSYWYEACPTPNCKKKVTLEDNGFYRCPKCQKSFEKCSFRYLTNLRISDNSDSIWVSVFDESGQVLFGASAERMYELSQIDEESFKLSISSLANKCFEMQISVKKEQGKIRGTIEKIKPMPDGLTLTKLYLTDLFQCFKLD